MRGGREGRVWERGREGESGYTTAGQTCLWWVSWLLVNMDSPVGGHTHTHSSGEWGEEGGSLTQLTHDELF